MPPTFPRPVLLVCRGLDPIGSGRQIELIAGGLVAAGADVHVALTTRGGSLPARLAAAGVTVHRIGMRPVCDGGAVLRLVRLARRLRPRPVVIWGRGHLPAAVALKCGCRTAPVVVQVAKPLRGSAERRLVSVLDGLIATTPAAAASGPWDPGRDPRAACIPPAACAAPPRGLDRSAIARTIGLDPARSWTLAVAPLVAASRLDRLWWAIDQLRVVNRDVEHVVVGAGPLRRQLERRARAQEIADRLVMPADCDLLPDLLRQVRLVWQSGSVALGGALADALDAGVPAVAVADDASRQLIADGETGRLVPVVPESELPRRAFELIEDEALAARFAVAARHRAAALFPLQSMLTAQIAACARLA
jgi:glycosyltransferase involved in cell wall biosynthesis